MSKAESDLLHLSVNDLSPEAAVAKIIEHCTDLQISDVFFTTNENHLAVQARHLGILRLITVMPSEMGRRCVSAIKATAGIDVAEKRRPMDGRWIYPRKAGSPVDPLRRGHHHPAPAARQHPPEHRAPGHDAHGIQPARQAPQ
jgi:type II secretory ATPase GspE/PulE/Tfp pilus assembly ATPase PilB-like protein